MVPDSMLPATVTTPPRAGALLDNTSHLWNCVDLGTSTGSLGGGGPCGNIVFTWGLLLSFDCRNDVSVICSSTSSMTPILMEPLVPATTFPLYFILISQFRANHHRFNLILNKKHTRWSYLQRSRRNWVRDLCRSFSATCGTSVRSVFLAKESFKYAGNAVYSRERATQVARSWTAAEVALSITHSTGTSNRKSESKLRIVNTRSLSYLPLHLWSSYFLTIRFY